MIGHRMGNIRLPLAEHSSVLSVNFGICQKAFSELNPIGTATTGRRSSAAAAATSQQANKHGT